MLNILEAKSHVRRPTHVSFNINFTMNLKRTEVMNLYIVK